VLLGRKRPLPDSVAILRGPVSCQPRRVPCCHDRRASDGLTGKVDGLTGKVDAQAGTLESHGGTLASHGEMLASHGEMLAEILRRLPAGPGE
jgi:hypothetical protein